MSFKLVGFAVVMSYAFATNSLAADVSASVEETQPARQVFGEQKVLTPLDSADLLRQAQSANDEFFSSLQSFVCDENVSRTRENLRQMKTRSLDTLTTRVSFENGQEQYSEVRKNGLKLPDLSAAGGAWSEGEFGTLLHQTQQLLKTQPVVFQGNGEGNEIPVTYVSFDVAQEVSPWILIVEGRSYRIPFHTEVGMETTSGHILSVKRTTAELPRELLISEIEWSVKMGPTSLAGASWLLPVEGEYAVSYANSHRRERNQMTFTNYRRYGSEVALRFDPIN